MALGVAHGNTPFHTPAPLHEFPLRVIECIPRMSVQGTLRVTPDSKQTLPCGNAPEAHHPREAAPSHCPQDHSFAKENLPISGLTLSTYKHPICEVAKGLIWLIGRLCSLRN